MAPSRAGLSMFSASIRIICSSSSQPRSCRQIQHSITRSYSQLTRSFSTPFDSLKQSTSSLWTRRYASAVAGDAQAVEPPDFLNEQEKTIFLQLREELQPTALEVQDVSGGCGSMYAVAVTSDRFKGLPMIKQHRLVNEILKEKIKGWHGLQLRTKAP